MKKLYTSVAAEPSIVKPFTNAILKAYNRFIQNFDGTVDYIDGVMALVNATKAVLAHINEQTGQSDDFWARTFVNTLSKSLGLEWHSSYAERWVITSRDGTLVDGFSLAQTQEACTHQYELDFGIPWEDAYNFGWRCRKVHIYIVEDGEDSHENSQD